MSLLKKVLAFLVRARSGAIKLPSAKKGRQVEQINRLEQGIRDKPDEELRRRVAAIRQQVRSGTRLDDLLIESFAIL